MGQIVTRGIGFGIWWASDPRRVWGTIGVIWLNTLKGPVGNWSRAMTWEAIKWGGRSVLGGLAITARHTWSKLLVPIAIWSSPVAVPIGVGAGVLVAAGIGAGIHTGLLQKAGLVGPDAQRASDPDWFDGLEMNPSMFSMGGVV